MAPNASENTLKCKRAGGPINNGTGPERVTRQEARAPLGRGAPRSQLRINGAAGLTVDGEGDASGQTRESQSAAMRQRPLGDLRWKQSCFQVLDLCSRRWTAGVRTEEILRTPPPSLSSTDDGAAVLRPPESRVSHNKVPSKPCFKEPDAPFRTPGGFLMAVTSTAPVVTWVHPQPPAGTP